MTEEQNNNLRYLMFKIEESSYYVGVVDISEYQDSTLEYFTVINPCSVLSDGDRYYVVDLEGGLGDSSYHLNINRNKIISVFSPDNRIIGNYEQFMSNKLKSREEDDYEAFFVCDKIQ